MRLKRILLFAVFGVVLIFLWAQMYFMSEELSTLHNRVDDLNGRSDALEKENVSLEQDLAFYTHPENIEKLLRGRFNYKRPGEHMIIVIPPSD